VASPGFVARRGQRWKLGHGALMVDFRAGCRSVLMTNSFVTNAVLIERAVSCGNLRKLLWQTIQYLDSWLPDLLKSELKMKLFLVEGVEAHAPLPHP